MDLAALDEKVNFDELNKDIKEAAENGGTGEFPELPAGVYFVNMENLELGETKDGRPMVKWQFRVIDAATKEDFKEFGVKGNNKEALDFMDNYKQKKKPCMFMNRVIYGNKQTATWNDGVAIQGVVSWLQKLECDFDVSFKGYADFAEVLLDVAEDMDGVEILVNYDPDAFNNVSVLATYSD